jgi:membrane fusion protein, heavy metal efflux system
VLDRETRTAKARIEVANPEGLLKPGMFATISVDTAAIDPALQVPERALVLLQGQMTAFVRGGDGFEPRPVETGPRRGDQIVVTSGLEPGDEVVVAGAYALKARLLRSQLGKND